MKQKAKWKMSDSDVLFWAGDSGWISACPNYSVVSQQSKTLEIRNLNDQKLMERSISKIYNYLQNLSNEQGF